MHFAAPIAVCRAAGCVVTDLAGEPVEDGPNGLIIAADRPTHEALLGDPPRRRVAAQRSQAVGPSVRGGLDASAKPRPFRYDVRMNPLRTRCGWSPTFWVFTIRAVR